MTERFVVQTYLEEAKAAGWIGSLRPLSWQIAHALEIAEIIELGPARVVDLGSGGGLPSLPLLERWRPGDFVLVEMQRARAALLRRALRTLALGPGVRVVEERAEVLAHQDEWRGWASAVVARSFGAPSLTAEVAAPLLVEGGLLVVSDLEGALRWPEVGLERLGLGWERRHEGARGTWAVVRKTAATPPWAPRSPKAMARRPLW